MNQKCEPKITKNAQKHLQMKTHYNKVELVRMTLTIKCEIKNKKKTSVNALDMN